MKGHAVYAALSALCALTSLLLMALVLTHRGSGDGLSELLGGAQSPAAETASATGNLTRFTLLVAVIWLATVIAIGTL